MHIEVLIVSMRLVAVQRADMHISEITRKQLSLKEMALWELEVSIEFTLKWCVFDRLLLQNQTIRLSNSRQIASYHFSLSILHFQSIIPI